MFSNAEQTKDLKEAVVQMAPSRQKETTKTEKESALNELHAHILLYHKSSIKYLSNINPPE